MTGELPERAGLWVVGTGIRALAQITPECRAVVAGATIVLHGVSDALTQEWLSETNPRCESLLDLYAVGTPRKQIYAAMVDRVVDRVRAGNRVCLALYGHPGVCAAAGHESVRQVRSEGYSAVMLPGISAESCLFADLGVDPTAVGCQSYETSLFLSRRARFDPRSALILWQIGLLGCDDYQTAYRPRGLDQLTGLLAAEYGAGHLVTLYELPSYATAKPIARTVPLAQLAAVDINWATTLYIPPVGSGSAERW